MDERFWLFYNGHFNDWYDCMGNKCISIISYVGGVQMIQFESLYREVFDVIVMKKQDLINQGVKQVREADIWQYFIEKKWQYVQTEDLHVYQIVSDLFSLTPEQFILYKKQQKDKAMTMLVALEH
ncbi:hypothetical protein DEX24_14035 [Kurthia sibirica]|uniref:Uncharacterized protein n=2 Tax=Kurthia sibirica TaxID=202750 RepID=A0A2U3AIG1_9BACL|nr:hypothetical protein DEX24_14035 [Kurthia sibirica]